MFISVYLEVQMSQQHWEENCPSPLNCLVSLPASLDHVWVGLLTFRSPARVCVLFYQFYTVFTTAALEHTLISDMLASQLTLFKST